MFLHHYFHRLGAVVSSRQGAKPACGSASFDGVAVKSAFALLLTKVTKDIPPQPSPVGLALAGISVPREKENREGDVYGKNNFNDDGSG